MLSEQSVETRNANVKTAALEVLPQFLPWQGKSQRPRCCIARTSVERRQRARNDSAFDYTRMADLRISPEDDDETILYLGYGSNLAAETFQGRRGIRPLSQVNVVVPELTLKFDLPGIPYTEPCFANSGFRDASKPDTNIPRPPYHKNAWKKGLVGVAYEVTKKDYAHIIATEGGGSGYQDTVVDCYALEEDPTMLVPENPNGTLFKAHTLHAPSDRALRSDPDYAQPSARYLKLITDGAREHNLPIEYRNYLDDIRSYHITNAKQRLGAFIFQAIWGPIIIFFIFGAGKIFLRKDGTYPRWYAKLVNAVFTAVWASYDHFFSKLFGEGERTIGDKALENGYVTSVSNTLNEKTPLLWEKSAHLAALEIV